MPVGAERSGMSLRISARGLEEAIETVDSIAARSQDLSGDLEKLGYRIAAAMKAKIRAGIGPPLTPAYALRKSRAGKGGEPVLVWSKELINSIKPLEVGRLIVRVGPEDPKAAFHLGARGKYRIDQVVDLDEGEWADVIERALVAGIFAGAEAALAEGSHDGPGLSEFPEAA